MVDESILNYFKNQINNGHSIQEIKSFLLQNNFSEKIIDECINEIYKANSQNYKQNYPNNSLNNQNIQTVNKKNNNSVNSNINLDNKENIKKKHTLGLLFLGTIFIIIILSISFFVFQESSTLTIEEHSLELTFILKENFYTNERISFQRTIISNSDNNLQANVKYKIYDNNRNLVDSFNETVHFLKSNNRFINFNSIQEEGSYTLEIDVNSRNIERNYQKRFNVIKQNIFDDKTDQTIDSDQEKKDDVAENIPRQCPIFYDDGDKCTRSYCNRETNYIPVHEPIIPCCGNNICESGEEETCPEDCRDFSDPSYFENRDIRPSFQVVDSSTPLLDQINDIQELSKTNLLGALEMCGDIIFDFFKDECFYKVATTNNRDDLCLNIKDKRTVDLCYTKLSREKDNHDLCGNIEPGLRRDSCYMRFVLKGNYEICHLLEDDYYKQTCSNLREINKASPESLEQFSKNIN